MSVVAVRVNKKSIIMGADSFVGQGMGTQIKDKHAKIFRVNGMVVGCVGYARDAILMKMYARTRTPRRSNNEDAMTDYLSEFIDWCKKKDDKYKLESSFLFVFLGKAWLLTGEFYIKEIFDYHAIGGGRAMALTALYLNKSVHQAIEAACELSMYCEEPINIIRVRK